MPYRVTHARWLATEADRVQAILLMPRHAGVTWTAASVREVLAGIGLDYTNAQLQEIATELVARNIIEPV